MEPRTLFATREIRRSNGLIYEGSWDPGLSPLLELGVEAGLPPLTGKVSVRLAFSVGASNILLETAVQGRWEVPCSRCLRGHEREFDGELEETYPLSQPSIDVVEELRQVLVLAAPQRSLCRPNCKGLCPRCGENLNEETSGNHRNHAKP